MRYEEIKGDLFSVGSEYCLAHCISADFGMGGGIVLLFNKKYDMKNRLKAMFNGALTDENEELVESAVVKVDNVYNLITKKNVWEKPTYKSMATTLSILKDQMIKNGDKKLAIPYIGCGIDGLNWKNVSNLVKATFEDTDIEIKVFYL